MRFWELISLPILSRNATLNAPTGSRRQKQSIAPLQTDNDKLTDALKKLFVGGV